MRGKVAKALRKKAQTKTAGWPERLYENDPTPRRARFSVVPPFQNTARLATNCTRFHYQRLKTRYKAGKRLYA